MSTTTSTAPELTQEQVIRMLIQPLEQRSVFLAAGPRFFDSANPVRIPSIASGTTPGFVAEAAEIPLDDVEFGEISLLPSTLQAIKVIVKFTNQLARQSVIALDAALRDRIVADVAAKLDTQFLSASGDGVTTPKGLFAYSGVQTLPVAGALTLDAMLDAWALALGANVEMSRLRWIMKPREFVKLRKLKDGQNRYQMTPDPTQDGVFRLFGAPVIVTSRVPDTQGGTPTARAALVDFSTIAVARDLNPTVKVLDQTYASTDEMALRVVCRMDAAPMTPEAVVVLSGITI